jgi:hypothetical protein
LHLSQPFFFWNGNGNRTGTVNSKLLYQIISELVAQASIAIKYRQVCTAH